MLITSCDMDETTITKRYNSSKFYSNERYSLLYGGASDLSNYCTLFDRENQKAIDDFIYSFKESGHYTYFQGSKGYIKLDLELQNYFISKDLSDFNNEDADIFNSLPPVNMKEVFAEEACDYKIIAKQMESKKYHHILQKGDKILFNDLYLYKNTEKYLYLDCVSVFVKIDKKSNEYFSLDKNFIKYNFDEQTSNIDQNNNLNDFSESDIKAFNEMYVELS